jgi:preprotein translocase subunit SecF
MKFIAIFDPKKEVYFIRTFKPAAIISVLLCTATLVALFTVGINLGIDFSGGVELQEEFKKPVTVGEIREVLEGMGLAKNQVQQYGQAENNEMLIKVERMAALDEKEVANVSSLLASRFGATTDKQLFFDARTGNQAYVWLKEPAVEGTDAAAIKQALNNQRNALADLFTKDAGIELRQGKSATEENATAAITYDDPKDGIVRYTVHFAAISDKVHAELQKKFGEVTMRRVDFVDSQVSRQIRTDGILALLYALIAIVIYVAIRFDLFFAPGAILALINDSLGAMLVFVIGRVEFDVPSIAALLTITGYSINNTIVIYDRIRETVPRKDLSSEELAPYVNKAINDTMSRTINTTITTLFASAAFWIFTTGAIQVFAMVLTIGITFGAFTSVFLAPGAYLFAKKYFRTNDLSKPLGHGPTREDRDRGIV